MTREELIGRIRELEDETGSLQQLVCYLLQKNESLRYGNYCRSQEKVEMDPALNRSDGFIDRLH